MSESRCSSDASGLELREFGKRGGPQSGARKFNWSVVDNSAQEVGLHRHRNYLLRGSEQGAHEWQIRHYGLWLSAGF
jgi:hypothetical protein